MSTDRRPARFGPLDEPAEFGRSHYPPIADYGFLSDCEPTASSRRAATSSGCACRAWTRRASSGRSSTATPAGSASAPPTCSCRPPAATCRARWSLETSWGTPTGWIIVRDTLLMGPWHHDDAARLDPPARPDRLRRRAHPAAHGPLRERRGAADDRLRAGVRLRRPSGAGSTPATATTRASAAPRRRRHADADHGHQPRLRGPARASRGR